MKIGSSCDECEAKDRLIAELIKVIQGKPPTSPPPSQTQTVFDTCPCNPRRGGSGICGCVIGGRTVIS